jgi:N-methylhydantoinase A
VRERIDAHGSVVEEVDIDDARRRVAELAAEGVNSVAVALLWSVANPLHEQQVADVVRAVLPDVHLALSSELVPKIGEYERTSTVVVDAYVGPLVSAYLTHLEARLRALGFGGLFVLMRMGGGVLPVALARRMPVHTLHSGPVGGVAAAGKLGAQLGHANIITTDVGGTSFDVGLVTGGEVLYSSKPMIERQALAIPVVDVTSIGTGGGSIAWIDTALGALRVGPASAGAAPGPACYGLGGTRPTVTDAAVILGYVDRLGGQLELDADAAAAAVEQQVAAPLGLGVPDAADGILHVACEQMRDLIRRTTIQRGHDPADFVLYAFGGAGPQYAGRYAADLGVPEVVVPALAAEFSAFGAAASELKTAVEQDVAPGDLHASLERVNTLLGTLEDVARRQLTSAEGRLVSLLHREPTVSRTVGLRFYRQIHRIDVSAPPGVLGPAEADQLLEAFRRRYELIVGKGTARYDTPVEVVTVGVEVLIPVPLVLPPSRPPGDAAPVRVRPAWFAGETSPCPVYAWDELGAGQEVKGPAFIESEETTVVVYPGQSTRLDHLGNIRMGFA